MFEHFHDEVRSILRAFGYQLCLFQTGDRLPFKDAWFLKTLNRVRAKRISVHPHQLSDCLKEPGHFHSSASRSLRQCPSAAPPTGSSLVRTTSMLSLGQRRKHIPQARHLASSIWKASTLPGRRSMAKAEQMR